MLVILSWWVVVVVSGGGDGMELCKIGDVKGEV